MDPIPEVRSVAARALGSLIRGMGEDNFPDLVPWLLDTLKSDGSNVERSGAAQGLSEVRVCGLMIIVFFLVGTLLPSVLNWSSRIQYYHVTYLLEQTDFVFVLWVNSSLSYLQNNIRINLWWACKVTGLDAHAKIHGP